MATFTIVHRTDYRGDLLPFELWRDGVLCMRSDRRAYLSILVAILQDADDPPETVPERFSGAGMTTNVIPRDQPPEMSPTSMHAGGQ